MKREEKVQIEVVTGETPQEFQKNFNDAMDLLAEYDPQYEFNHAMGFCAYITYNKKIYVMDCVADEFHAEGIHYHCRNCPYMEDPRDKRVKYCTCKYHPLGRTHKDHEACEMLYKEVKQGRVKLLEDWER